MRYKKYLGIVLSSLQLKEANKLVIIISKEKGKIKVIATGANKTLSRKNYNLDSINLLNFSVYSRNSEFDVITETILVDDFSKLKKDYTSVKFVYYLLEVINIFLPDEVAYPNLFDSIVQLLNMLNSLEDEDKKMLLLVYTQLYFLNEFGFSPEINNCISCGDKLEENIERILSDQEILGFVCNKHFDKILNREDLIDDNVLKVQRFLMQSDIQGIFKLRTDKALLKRIFGIQNFWIESAGGRRIKSYKLIK